MVTHHKLIVGDCLEVMRGMPDESIDLIITSPPYNVGMDYGKGREKDKLPFCEYVNFSNELFLHFSRLLKTGGRCCIEFGGSGRNFPTSWMWQDSAYKNNLKLFSEIIIPHRKTNECAWGSWLRANNVYTIPNFHLAYVFYKNSATKNGEKCDIDAREFSEWTRGHWHINYSGRVSEHPAEFPCELPIRFMKLFGHVGDTILDPFAGSFTTSVAARDTGRNSIGIEINPEYVAIGKRRLGVDTPPLDGSITYEVINMAREHLDAPDEPEK